MKPSLREAITAAEIGKTWLVWRPILGLAESEVKLAVLRGSANGPTLWLQACLHGDEVDAALVAHHVAMRVDPRQIAGTVVILPVAHKRSFIAGQRYNPSEQEDINRCFPGNAKGSETERLAWALWSEITASADYLLDLHSSTTTYLGAAHAIYFESSSATSVVSRELARHSGLPILWESTGTWLSSALYVAATKKGIPSALLDVGDLSTQETLEVAVEGIVNVLRYVQLLGEPPTISERQLVVRDPEWISSQADGMRVETALPGTRVRQGDVLFRVLGDEGEERECAVAKHADGLVVTVRRERVARVGLDVISVGSVRLADCIGVESEGATCK